MFRACSVYDLKQNAFEEIGRNWMLITARKPDGCVNTMTASWGAMGVLWGKETLTVYIRESRYTKAFVDAQDYFTVSLFDGHKDALKLLGTQSGRDGNKIAEAGLHLIELDNQPGFAESKCVFICRKIYHAELETAHMPDSVREKLYLDDNFHTQYIGEIVGCYVRD